MLSSWLNADNGSSSTSPSGSGVMHLESLCLPMSANFAMPAQAVWGSETHMALFSTRDPSRVASSPFLSLPLVSVSDLFCCYRQERFLLKPCTAGDTFWKTKPVLKNKSFCVLKHKIRRVSLTLAELGNSSVKTLTSWRVPARLLRTGSWHSHFHGVSALFS